MRTMLILIAAITQLILSAGVASAEFRVRKIVPIQDNHSGPIQGDCRWANDGVRFAYFRDQWLCVADTTGQSKEILQIHGVPGRYEWLDSARLVVNFQEAPEDRTRVNRISVIDVTLGIEQLLDGANRITSAGLVEGPIIDGPKRTQEGNLFYGIGRDPRQTKKRIEANGVRVAAAAASAEDHFLRWWVSSDGLYKVALDGSDSVRLLEGKQPGGSLHLDIDPNGEYLVKGRVLRSLSGPDFIDMGASIPSAPAGSVCGIFQPLFNRKFREVSVWVTCDDGHEVTDGYGAIFDIATRKLYRTDSLTAKVECGAPNFSPDGATFVVTCGDNMYLVFREVGNGTEPW